MRDRLSEATLPQLPAFIATPEYDRSAIRAGIVHLGVGAFHRAHQAVYVDDCLAAGERDWGIIGASLRAAETRDALNPQDGLFTLAVRDSGSEVLRIIGSLVSVLAAPNNPGKLLDTLSNPAIRIVTLTVTEKGYLRSADGSLNRYHPDITHDLASPTRPKTIHGFLSESLFRRRNAGIAPFTVLCCDNLQSNGATVRRALMEFGEMRDSALAGFIADHVAFPSCMIDRIVPATKDADREDISGKLGLDDAWPVVTEPYSQWVVEDNFPTGRPKWERFGVSMVKDVSPFEDMKLRLLNGAHSALAYLGLLSGYSTVDAAFGDPSLRRFIDGLWGESAMTLSNGLDWRTYTEQLAGRFANTTLVHQTRQIATDGSQKLPQRIIAPALMRLRQGEAADYLAMAPAAWIAACEARCKVPGSEAFTDPADADLGKILVQKQPAKETVDAVFDLCGFGAADLMRDTLISLVASNLQKLREGGLHNTLRHLSQARQIVPPRPGSAAI